MYSWSAAFAFSAGVPVAGLLAAGVPAAAASCWKAAGDPHGCPIGMPRAGRIGSKFGHEPCAARRCDFRDSGPRAGRGQRVGRLSPWSWSAGPGSVSPGPEVVPVAVGGLFHQGSPGGLAGRSAATADHEYMAPEAATRHDPSTVMSAGMFALPCVRIRHTPCAVGRRHTECAAYIVFRRTRWRPRSVRQRGRKNCRSTPALRPAR